MSGSLREKQIDDICEILRETLERKSKDEVDAIWSTTVSLYLQNMVDAAVSKPKE